MPSTPLRISRSPSAVITVPRPVKEMARFAATRNPLERAVCTLAVGGRHKPAKPVAYNYGLLSVHHGPLWGLVADCGTDPNRRDGQLSQGALFPCSSCVLLTSQVLKRLLVPCSSFVLLTSQVPKRSLVGGVGFRISRLLPRGGQS